jgi:xanthosine utilization system XapX-like protein
MGENGIEVKLTQVRRCFPPEVASIGLVEITIGREAAMIRIGNGRQGRACLRERTWGSRSQ